MQRGATAETASGATGALDIRRPWPTLTRLLPTPTGTPFTFGYAAVLVLTSVFTELADPDFASVLWIGGGVTSPYAIGFLLVLTALERRIGGLRTAGVFLLGHVVATLATEVPVGLSVLAGQLPDSSLHRLDYGISFAVMAGVGALAGLVTPLLRWLLLAGVAWMLLEDLIAFTDPLTNWGHLLAFALGLAVWLSHPVRRSRTSPPKPARPAFEDEPARAIHGAARAGAEFR